MRGKLFLSGGGDEKGIFESFFTNTKRVLYVPLAWPNDDFDSCLKWFKEQTTPFPQLKIQMLTDANQTIDLTTYDAIFIGGGNTFKLLKRLRDSKLEKKLIDFYDGGGRIYGGSAGAIIWGNSIDTALICKDKDKNLVGLKNTQGFNKLSNYDIQCHFEPDQVKEHQEYISRTKRNIIAIPEGSALLVDSGAYKIIGHKPITVITEKEAKQYQPNSTIPL